MEKNKLEDMMVVIMPVKHLRPAPYNPRKDLAPGDPEYERIKASLRYYGLVEPLVWNRRTSLVVGGHQRLKVLKELGAEKVPVVVVNLDPKDEAALNIALNKVSGKWDKHKLATKIVELDDGDFPILATGFDHLEAKALVEWERQEGERMKICPTCGSKVEA